MENLRIIVAGSRNFTNYNYLKNKLDSILNEVIVSYDIIIVSGTARGVDTFGEKYAEERGLAVERYPANWDKYGKSAGYRRNVEMAKNADVLVAFWDGSSKGTKHMIDIAQKKGLIVRVINF